MADHMAVITGAGGGMGRVIAHRLAEAGIQVILTGRTKTTLEAVADDITQQGGSAVVYPLDVTDGDQIQAFAGWLADRPLDMLINCAGDWLIKSIDDTTPDDLDHILAVNLKGPYLMAKALLPHLRKSDNASIIHIGSLTAVESHADVTAYTAAKTGLRGLTGSLADELRPDCIRVIMLAPGPADTPMRDAATPGVDKSTLVPPEAIAQMLWALVSLPCGITTDTVVLRSMQFGG